MKPISVAALLLCLLPGISLAWGRTGHQLVATIAMRQLSAPARQNVIALLGDLSPEDAAVWMDEQRSEPAYQFMKPWHYINIEKGQAYHPSTDEDIVNALLAAYRELKHRRTLCNDQARTDALVLFHLTGDLHQPLHTGYGADRGGNTVTVTFDGRKTNLHALWDDDLIAQQHIRLSDCMELAGRLPKSELSRIRRIDFIDWMNGSRDLLGRVYDFTGGRITPDYAARSKALLLQQLTYAGLRLGALLEQLFREGTIAPATAVQAVPTGLPAILMPHEAILHAGEQVTVCGKVYGCRYLAKSKGSPTFINMGAAYPESPFTVVIFGSDRDKFPYQPETYFEGKDVCVTGRIKRFKGKAEIIVSKPDQLRLMQ